MINLMCNISMRVLNTCLKRKLEMPTFVKMHTFNLSKEYSFYKYI